jgi:hypothetical protein
MQQLWGMGTLSMKMSSTKKTKVVKQQFQANVVHEDKEEEKYVGTNDGKQ